MFSAHPAARGSPAIERLARILSARAEAVSVKELGDSAVLNVDHG
jgi:hypothetical protein